MAFVGSITQYQEVVIATLKAENARLRGVLEFYADSDNWQRFYALEIPRAYIDRGAKARAVLEHRMSDSMSTTPETPE